MPRPKKANPKPAHRPQKPIDWERVDELLMAGCLGTEIAPHFDMHYQTFYERVEIEKGMSFTQYSTQKRSQGDAILREVQYQKALSADNTMLVWLGKNRLGQKETPNEISIDDKTVKSFTSLMGMISELQKKPDQT